MSKIKKCFTSRWGEEGILLEVDYSQLEVCALAYLSQDPTLLADLQSGMDLHRMRAAELYHIKPMSVTAAQRRIAKALSFMLQYGAGSKHMAEQLGIPEADARAFVTAYYERYKRVKSWHSGMIAGVTAKAYVPKNIQNTPKGYPAKESIYPSPTGRRYLFRQSDAPAWLAVGMGTDVSFKPTEIKNRPVQGFATGDIMAIARGATSRALVSRGWLGKDVVRVISVHDSQLFDMKKELLYTTNIKEVIHTAMVNTTKDILAEEFDLAFLDSLFLDVDFKAGDNWHDMKEIA